MGLNKLRKILSVILVCIIILFFSCTPPIHTGGSGNGTDGPYDLTTIKGFQRALADDEYMQSLESTFAEAGVSENFMYGDVNGDSIVDITDALLTARHFARFNDAEFIHADAADVDDNGLIDIVDAMLIARYFVKLINSFPAEDNLVSNGHFHAGDKDWGYFEQEGGLGSMEVVDGELRVTVDNGGDHLWSFGIAQLDFNMQEGQYYIFKFKARSAAGASGIVVRTVFQLQQEQWNAHFEKNIVISEKMQTFSVGFKMRVADPVTGFNFHLGGPNSGDIYIDDVCLYAAESNLYPALTADPLAAEDTKRIYEYLAFLSSDNFNGVISGQNCYHGNEITSTSSKDGYNNLVVELYNQTGKWVGMIGIDYEFGKVFTLDELSQANQILIDYWSNGGLITINWSPHNPWVNDESDIIGNPDTWDGPGCTSDHTSVDLTELIDPSTEVYNVWRRKLDRIATALAELRDAGVVVLWRPLQEANLRWCWWGVESHPSDPRPYTNLFRDMFNYFTYEKQLHNLIWVYSPAAIDDETAMGDPDIETVAGFYPGDGYVDIVSGTAYNDELTIYGYEELIALGKPVGMAEYGPTLWGELADNGTFDTTTYINRIRQDYPRVAYWVSW